MEEEEIGQEFDRVIRAAMMAASSTTDAIARRSAEQARLQREGVLVEARALDVASKQAERTAREAAQDARAVELADIRAARASTADAQRLSREALQVADRSIGRDEWWKNATPARIADTVSLAAEAAPTSPMAASVYERMATRINDLYDVDLNNLRDVAGGAESNRHSALLNAVDDALARRREEAEAANAGAESADAAKDADRARQRETSPFAQYADRDWLDQASADDLAHAYGQTAGPAERDDIAFVANGRIENALHERFGVVEVIDKKALGTPEKIEAETSRLLKEAEADRGNTDREYAGTEAGEHQVRAAAAGTRAERHEDLAQQHGMSEKANMAKAAAAQSPTARAVSESYPDTVKEAIGKARRRGGVKARVDRGASKERSTEHVIER